MNLLLHHVRKDLRHSRWLIALTWLVAAGVLWLPTMPIENRSSSFEWLPFIRYGSWLLLFLTVGRIVQLDAPLRETAFLRSRPISSVDWLGSKLLASGIVLLPMAMIDAVMLPLAGLQPEFADLLIIFAEEILVLSVVAALAITLAARARTYSQFIANMMSIALAALIVLIIFVNAKEWLTRGTKAEWSYNTEYLELSRLLITQLATTLSLLAGLFLCIRERQPERLTAIIPATAFLAAFVWFFWPINFVKTFTRPEAEAPRAEWPDQSKIEFEFAVGPFADNDESRVSWGFGGYDDVHYQHIKAFTRMDGVGAGWFAHMNGYNSKLKSPSNEIARSSQTGWASLDEELILPFVGIPDPSKRINGATGVNIGDFPTKAIEAAGKNATLEGVVHIPLKRPVVLARIPLKAGATARIGKRKITITNVEITSPDRISYQVIEERPMSNLRGGRHGEPHRRIQMLAINRDRGQFLQNQSGGTSNLSTPHYAIHRDEKEQLMNRFGRREDQIFPPGWLDGAELIITGDEYGGTFTREFRFENLDLIDTKWRP